MLSETIFCTHLIDGKIVIRYAWKVRVGDLRWPIEGRDIGDGVMAAKDVLVLQWLIPFNLFA